MRPKQFFRVMLGTLVLLGLLIVGAGLGGNILLKDQSERLNALKLDSRVLQEQQTLLNRAKKDIATYSELNDITKAIVPQDKDQAKTVRAISAAAEQSGIQLNSISFANSDLGQKKTTTTTKGSSSKSKAPTLSQVKPVVGIPGVYSLEINISSNPDTPIAYEKFLEFLERLEASRRTAHVTSVSITPNDDGSKLSFKLTLNAYIKS